jgi:vitamin B12 transporter
MRRRFLSAPAAGLLLALSAAPSLAQRPLPLDTLHATGTRLHAPAAGRSLEVIDRAAIEQLPAASVADVLARALGVDLQRRSPAQADLSIRGGGFEHVLVLVDGVPVNDEQTGHFHLDLTVPLDAVERIEVLRGPASAVYGSAAVGGVVNIVTRGTGREIAARAQGGSFGAVSGGLEIAAGGGSGARLSLEHDRSDGHRTGTDHRMSQARLALAQGVAGGRLSGSVGYAARDFGANAFYAPFDSWEETRTLTAAIAWQGPPATVSVAPRLSFRQHDDDFVLRRGDPAFYRNVHTSRQTALELVARVQGTSGLRAAVGAEGALANLRSRSLGDRDEHRLAAFAELVAGDVARNVLSVGLRADRHSSFGAFLSPSLAGYVSLGPAVRLRASAAGGFRAPSWTERYYEDPANVATADLAAEKFWNGELGVALAHGKWNGDVAGFVRRATDLIDWARPAGAATGAPWRTRNVQEATFAGLEAVTGGRFQRLELRASAAVTSVAADAADGFVSKYALRPLDRAAALHGVLLLPANARLAGRASHARRGEESWELLDVRLAVERGGAHLFLDATNLADARYRDIIGQPAPGRALAAGIRVRR